MKRSVKKKEYESVLILKKAEGKENVFHKFKERDCRIGKDANCEINITGEGIEPFHVHISHRNGDFYLRSLSALEVTFIKVDSRVAIYHGMKVEMGSNIFKLTFEPAMKLKTEIVEGKNVGEVLEFPPTKGKISIGRKSNNDIHFPRDTTLSNLHAKITYTNFGWYIEDLMTTNGTWMEAEKEIKISSGMIFKLGTTNYQFSCELQKVKSNENEEESIVMMQKETLCCLVCQEEPREVLLLPCSHCVTCEKCSKNLSFCLICHQRFASTTKIFRT